MTWVWATFWVEDLHRSPTRAVLLLIPAAALVFAAWPGPGRFARAVLGAALGLVPVWVFFVIRDLEGGHTCSWSPSESYERALTWTFAAFLIWGLSRAVQVVNHRSSRERLRTYLC